jgi:hypothetical protein
MNLLRLKPKEEKALLHQEVCDLYGLTRFELANKLGVTKATLDSWSDESRMSKSTKLALELMMENYYKTKLLSNLAENISAILDINTNNSNSSVKDDGQMLVERMKYVLKEIGINTITASEKLGEASFEQLDAILKLKAFPSFSLLENFSKVFAVSNEWLKTGSGQPFDIRVINSYTLHELASECKNFEKLYIIHSKDNKPHTKIVVEYQAGKFDIFRMDFCIGDDFIMLGSESNDLFSLYKFYRENEHKISLVSLEHEEYDKLISREYYAGNILKSGKYSHMLYDLFDLDYFNKEKYGDFFVECTDIIKNKKESEENKTQKEKKC